MDYAFEHPDFQGRSLAFRTSGPLSAVRLVLDGAEVAGSKGRFTLHDNRGQPRELRLKPSYFDPVPTVTLDGTAISLVPPLAWYEYAWMGLPIILVFAGGALGAMFGIGASFVSARIFRSDRGAVAKYSLSALVSLAAVAAFAVGVIGLQLALSFFTDPASKSALREVARVSNEGLPIMVDEETEMVKLEGLEGVLVYHYRLTKVPPGRVSAEALEKGLRPAVASHACELKEMRERFLDHAVTLRYVYYDAQNGPIGQFDVSAADCP